MPFGQAAASASGKIRRAMIEAIVEAELVLHVGAFLRPAGDADRTRALDLGDLPDHRADRARTPPRPRRSRPAAACRFRAAPCRRSCPACRARQARSRPARASDRSCAGPCRRRPHGSASRVWPSTMSPAAKVRIVRGDHFADGAAFHHLADLDRRGVGRRVAHAAAHVGIEREPDRAQAPRPAPGFGTGNSSRRSRRASARRPGARPERCGGRSRSWRAPISLGQVV